MKLIFVVLAVNVVVPQGGLQQLVTVKPAQTYTIPEEPVVDATLHIYAPVGMQPSELHSAAQPQNSVRRPHYHNRFRAKRKREYGVPQQPNACADAMRRATKGSMRVYKSDRRTWH